MTENSIFLHGLWRSGSTFIWSRFRELTECCCFYEPLHQGLHRLTPERISGDTAQKIEESRHPRLEKPYFHEYLPLVHGHGVRKYRRSFGVKKYHLHPEEKCQSLKDYISYLIEYSRLQQLRPVLGFNRANLRIGWLRNNFESTNIYIRRSPRKIFESYYRHMSDGHVAFMYYWPLIVEKNQDSIGHYFDAPGLRKGLHRLQKPKRYYVNLVKNSPQEILYDFVYTFWVLSELEASKFADIIIDMDRDIYSPSGKRTTNQIYDQTGLEINLSELRRTTLTGFCDLNYSDVERRVEDRLASRGLSLE